MRLPSRLAAVVAPLTAGRRQRDLDAYLAAGLPMGITDAARFLVTGKADAEARAIADAVEARRAVIATGSGARVWYSPKPGSAQGDRPAPGEVMEFSAERVAQTGKDRRWGTTLYLIARGFGCSSGLELGTCAGISAMYVAPTLGSLLTVEGSEDLSAIARETLASFSHVRVVNALFDDALDGDIGALDYAFIDGHHEQVATIHYAERILPAMSAGGVMVFDDISWSADMREAWGVIRRWPWADAIDLGVLGVCITGDGGRQWDLQPIVGRTAVGVPWGWD